MTCDLTIDILCDVYGFDRKWPRPTGFVQAFPDGGPQCARVIDTGQKSAKHAQWNLYLTAHCSADRVQMHLLSNGEGECGYFAIRVPREARTALDIAQILNGLLPLEA